MLLFEVGEVIVVFVGDGWGEMRGGDEEFMFYMDD